MITEPIRESNKKSIISHDDAFCFIGMNVTLLCGGGGSTCSWKQYSRGEERKTTKEPRAGATWLFTVHHHTNCLAPLKDITNIAELRARSRGVFILLSYRCVTLAQPPVTNARRGAVYSPKSPRLFYS